MTSSSAPEQLAAALVGNLAIRETQVRSCTDARPGHSEAQSCSFILKGIVSSSPLLFGGARIRVAATAASAAASNSSLPEDFVTRALVKEPSALRRTLSVATN